MSPLELLILMLATWRLAHMLVLEDGPFQVIQRFRAMTTLGGLLECIFCMSVWVALGLTVAVQGRLNLVDVLAVSAGSLVIDRYVNG